jgi:trk system potassium uptake protein TrkH
MRARGQPSRRPPRIVRIGGLPKGRRPRQANPSYLVYGFAGLIAAGTLLLLLPVATAGDGGASLITAFFTSTSAVCVTGLIIVDTGEYWTPFGQVVILILVQLGGIGFMASATLLLMLVGRKLSLSERLLAGQTLGRYGVRSVARFILRIALATAALEAIGAAVLLVALIEKDGFETRDIWNSVFLAVSAVNNAGFELEGGFASISLYRSDIGLVATLAVLVALGSLGYSVWADVAGVRSWRRLSLDTKLILMLSVPLWVLGAAVIMALEHVSGGMLSCVSTGQQVADATTMSFFTRTGGFTTVDLTQADESTLFFLSGLMFIGGAPASTSGGIRLVTFAVLVLAAVAAVRGRERIVAFGREIAASHVLKALSVTAIAAAVVFTLAFSLSALEDRPFIALFFEAVSSFSTVGFSAGVTPALGDVSLLLLAAGMFIGRLGPLTFALALIARAEPERVGYPQEAVSIG